MDGQEIASTTSSPVTVLPPDAFDSERAFSVRDWNCEISRVYRAARRGRIDAQRACRLVFVAAQGLKAAGQLEELERIAAIQKQLTEIEGRPMTVSSIADRAEVAA